MPHLFLRLFLPITVLVAAGTYFYGKADIERELALLANQETLNVDRGAVVLRRNLDTISSDLRFLSRHGALRDAIDAPTQSHLARLAEDFSTFAQSKGFYDQVRWIDESGMERVRIDSIGAQSVVLPPDQLQDKGKRYYFTDSIKLSPGQIYVSPLDLNVEQDKIDVPYKPMLRIATPVADRAGNKRGIVILNYYGRELLDVFSRASITIGDHIMMLNGDGYFLKSPDRQQEWGFMLQRPDLSLAQRAPAAWARIRDADSGQQILADGLWTWQTVHPLLAGQRSGTGGGAAFVPSRSPLEAAQYVWKSVAYLSADRLSATRQTVWSRLVPLAAVLLGLLGFGTWKLARAWNAQALAEANVRRINAELEATIAERTEQLNAKVIELNDANEELAYDIVAHKKVQMALRDSELRFRSFVENASDVLFVLTPSAIFSYVSPQWAVAFGYEIAETLGQPFIPFVHPDDVAGCATFLQEVITTGEKRSGIEYRVHCKDGSYRWYTANGSRSRDPVSGEFALLGIGRDITERKQTEQALARTNQEVAERQALLQQILYTASVAIFWVDMQGHITHANRRMAEMFGRSEQELERQEYVQLLDASEQTVGRQRMLALLRSEIEHVDVDRAFLRADGSQFWGHLAGKRFYDVSGRQLGLIGVISDITDRKKAQDRLQLAASVFTHAREGIMITDASASILEVNDTFTLITGYSREEVLGQNPHMLASGRQPPEFYATMWHDLTDKGHWVGEVWNRRKDGELYAEMLTISAVRDSAGATQNYVALFSDITAIKEHQSQLEHVAQHDPLTNFPNRTLLADRLQQGIAQCQRRDLSLAVAYLDLDNFKAINDQHGHAVGDLLLIEVSRRMKDVLREGDTLARIGGDEFVAVIVDLAQPQDCLPVIERLLRAAAVPVPVAARAGNAGDAAIQVMQVSASIGVTYFPQDCVDADQLLHADQAMYAAKQAGKNRFHLFDIAQDAEIHTRHESVEQIRHALDNREFVLYYQPKVNMASGRVVGAEALIRWQHPTQGLLPPAAFLPVIENHPISVALGEWVITTALQQMSDWKSAGLDLAVSVNVSARQLQEADFTTRLSALLQSHPQIPPSWLDLEVLETSALEDITQVSDVMRACQGLGVRFALDDFGTGYSSLTYLRRLPAAVLKIDRSFVRDMIHDPDDLAIVQGVIGLCAIFHREVIAEGVETAAHGAMLQSLGCDLAQGYGIARPMPAADIALWVARWHDGAVWAA